MAIYWLWAIVLVTMLFPIAWSFSTSIKSTNEQLVFPPNWIPRNPTLQNYLFVIKETGIPRQIRNSVIIALATSILSTLISVLAGYGFSRSGSRWKNVLLFGVFSMEIITGLSIVVGIYKLANLTGFLDSMVFLVIVYVAMVTPFSVWYMKNYFDALPRDLEEAAIIDGCSRLQMMRRILFPLVRPGIASVAIYAFVAAWNEFLIASILLVSDAKKTLPLGIFAFIDTLDVQWGYICAAAILGLLPAMAVFIIMQRLYISGLTEGALK